MTEQDDFWGDLLGHLREKRLVAVIGPDLNVVPDSGTVRTLTEIIARRLNTKYNLRMTAAHMTMGEAVGRTFRRRGRDEAFTLYRQINDIISEYDGQPCEPLRELASITDLRLFVSTTPDGLLATAVNDVRFDGRPGVRELTFSPPQSTGEQAENLTVRESADATVLRLFGQAASVPHYAIHEEDLLEWLHALLSGTGCLPDWVTSALKHRPLLFIGCEMPDWLGRLLVRVTSPTRLSEGNKQFFFVHSPAARQPLLSTFFATYCRKAQVRQLEMTPRAFVTELRERWRQNVGGIVVRGARRGSGGDRRPARLDTSFFISYLHEDVDAAERLEAAITGLGGEAWFDTRRLRPGDTWEEEIVGAIGEVRLFLALISANTEQKTESYVFREWRKAVSRSNSIVGRRFIVPIVIDLEPAEPHTYRKCPASFWGLQFSHAPGGDPSQALRSLLVEEITRQRGDT